MSKKHPLHSIQNYLELFIIEHPDIFEFDKYQKCLNLIRVLFGEKNFCKDVCEKWSEKKITAGVIWLFSCINFLYKENPPLTLNLIADYFEMEKKEVQRIMHTLHDSCGIGEVGEDILV